MSFGSIIGLFLLTLSVFASIGLIEYFVIKGKKTFVFYSFLWCQVLLLIWSLGMIFEMLMPNRTLKWVVVCIEYFPISFIGISWVIFSLFYTESKFFNKVVKIIPLFIPPIVSYIMLLTNQHHNLFYEQFEYRYKVYGIFFWLNVIQVYFYIMIANFLMIKYSLKQIRFRKEQTILIVLTSIIPILSNAMYVLKIVKFDFDLTPVSFCVSMIFASIAVFKYRFLDIVSNALIKVFDNMNEAMVIVNSFDKVIDFNKSFRALFSNNKISVNDDIRSLATYLNKKVVQYDRKVLNAILNGTTFFVSGELVLKNTEYAYYLINVQPIFNSTGGLLGRVITFNNISSYKNLMSDLDSKNKELSLINEQLKEHLTTAAELASEKERNRIAQEVHDTLGHTLTLLITLLEVCKITYKNDIGLTEEKLNEAADTARQGLKELRESLIHIKSERLQPENFVTSLKTLIAGFELTGMKVDFVADTVSDSLPQDYADAVYRVCKEALTNSLRHGKAENISIILRLDDSILKLFILDDGAGCNSIEKGLGLQGMEDRVKALGGSIAYGSDGEKGFNIHIEIPIGGDI